MPGLGDTYDNESDESVRRRGYLKGTLLFVGAVVAAPALSNGLARALVAVGVGEGAALTMGIGIVALAVPITGTALLRWLPSDRRARRAVAAGVVVAAVGVAGFVAGAPADGGLEGVSSIVLATYGAGVLLAIAGPAVSARLAGNQATPSRPSTAFVRERRSVKPSGRLPADGGEEDQELAFLLETDDE